MEKRIEWIDIAKGIGIILVFLGHCSFNNYFNSAIYTFHIPLFFFLSGYVFNGKNYNFFQFLWKKIKSIVIPYISLGIVIAVFLTLVCGNDFKEIFLVILIQKRFTVLWFFTSIFCVNIVFYIFNKLVKNNLIILGIISTALAIVGIQYYKYGGQSLPWNVDTVMTTMFFFYIGYLVKQKPIITEKIFNLSNTKKWMIFVSTACIDLIVGFISSYFADFTHVDIFSNKYATPILTYIGALFGISSVIVFSKILESYSLKKPFEYIGKNSIIYFSLHQSVTFVLMDMFYEAIGFSVDTTVNLFIKMILTTFVSLLLLTAVNEIVIHTPLCFMAGRYKIKKFTKSKEKVTTK